LCEKHRLEYVTDEMLRNSGAAELVKSGLRGSAAAFKRRR
jgi:hypothetical protein